MHVQGTPPVATTIKTRRYFFTLFLERWGSLVNRISRPWNATTKKLLKVPHR